MVENWEFGTRSGLQRVKSIIEVLPVRMSRCVGEVLFKIHIFDFDRRSSMILPFWFSVVLGSQRGLWALKSPKM